MKRIQLTKVERDEFDNVVSVVKTSKWFNAETAFEFDGKTYSDGQNKSSVNCPKHFFQSLYRTNDFNWVLCEWNEIAGVRTTYEQITYDRAIEWLITNGHDDELTEEEVRKFEL